MITLSLNIFVGSYNSISSQVSARDLELAKLEVVNLERRFRLRIEHGSSLPVSSNFSERLRNARNELDHANFMRASYLFVNRPVQNPPNAGPDFNMPQAVPQNSYADSNFSLAFLQSLAQNGQQSHRPPIPGGHQNFPPNGALGNRMSFPPRQANHQAYRNGASQFFDVQQQRQPQFNSNLLSALMGSQGVGSHSQR